MPEKPVSAPNDLVAEIKKATRSLKVAVTPSRPIRHIEIHQGMSGVPGDETVQSQTAPTETRQPAADTKDLLEDVA